VALKSSELPLDHQKIGLARFYIAEHIERIVKRAIENFV